MARLCDIFRFSEDGHNAGSKVVIANSNIKYQNTNNHITGYSVNQFQFINHQK